MVTTTNSYSRISAEDVALYEHYRGVLSAHVRHRLDYLLALPADERLQKNLASMLRAVQMAPDWDNKGMFSLRSGEWKLLVDIELKLSNDAYSARRVRRVAEALLNLPERIQFARPLHVMFKELGDEKSAGRSKPSRR